MSYFLKLQLAISRWRHGRGFGIHSPFAYRFVTEVLRQQYGYYAYLRYPTDERWRAIFRVVLALRPASVALVGSNKYKNAVREAMPKVRFTKPSDADMVIVDATSDSGLDLSRYSGKHVIVLNYRKLPSWDAYKSALSRGMTFANGGGMAVGVALPNLPRQDFDVRF